MIYQGKHSSDGTWLIIPSPQTNQQISPGLGFFFPLARCCGYTAPIQSDPSALLIVIWLSIEWKKIRGKGGRISNIKGPIKAIWLTHQPWRKPFPPLCRSCNRGSPRHSRSPFSLPLGPSYSSGSLPGLPLPCFLGSLGDWGLIILVKHVDPVVPPCLPNKKKGEWGIVIEGGDYIGWLVPWLWASFVFCKHSEYILLGARSCSLGLLVPYKNPPQLDRPVSSATKPWSSYKSAIPNYSVITSQQVAIPVIPRVSESIFDIFFFYITFTYPLSIYPRRVSGIA